MKVLIDECVPRKLKAALAGVTCATVAEMGWGGTQNGDLLRLMTAHGFTALLTVDQNLPYQQPIGDFDVAVVVMVARFNKLEHLLPLVPQVLACLSTLQAGEVIRVE